MTNSVKAMLRAAAALEREAAALRKAAADEGNARPFLASKGVVKMSAASKLVARKAPPKGAARKVKPAPKARRALGKIRPLTGGYTAAKKARKAVAKKKAA